MNRKKIIVIVAFVVLFVLFFNIITHINRMNYCNEKIQEIESGLIADPSHIFNKQNLTKNQFLDFLNIFEEHDYNIHYYASRLFIHGFFSEKKEEIFNRINSNNDNVLYSSYVYSYSLDDELCVGSILIQEINPDMSEDQSKHYSYNFDDFLSTERRKLYIERSNERTSLIKKCIRDYILIFICILEFIAVKESKQKKVSSIITLIITVICTIMMFFNPDM